MSPAEGEGAGATDPAPAEGAIPYTVTRVPVRETLALRQAVLRPDQTPEQVALPEMMTHRR